VVVHNGGRADAGRVLVERGEGLRVRVVDTASRPGLRGPGASHHRDGGLRPSQHVGRPRRVAGPAGRGHGASGDQVWIPPQCPNEVYENRMASTFAGPEFQGIEHVAFADLFLEDIRAYREGRLAQAGKRGVFPIWGHDTAVLAREMIANGFRAIVVCVDPRALDRAFAGRAFDERFLADLPDGVDPCGENGEFHTFVQDGPLFGAPISCRTGEIVDRDGFVYCDVVPE
jgi:hypothetical protein